MLAHHPDQFFVKYIIDGLTYGFCIGFDYSSHKCHASSSNHLSVLDNPDVVKKYIEDECVAGRILGPVHSLLYPSVHTCPFGVIPKPDKPGKWRLILDLSYPEGASVNTGIKKETSSLSYVSLDHIVKKVLELGVGSLLTQIDIKTTFRLISVHPQDQHLLGMKWQGALHIDCVLPFGLRSAPKIFNLVADAL